MPTNFLHFSGMLQSTTSTFLRRADQLIFSMNVQGDNIGSLTKRLGYSEYGTSSNGQSTQGLYSYNDIGGATRYLYRGINGIIQQSTGGAFTNVITGLSTTVKMEFQTFIDLLFVVGGTGSTYMSTQSIDASSDSGASISSAPNGKYVAVYKDRLYIANTDGYPSRFYWSSLPNSAGTAITWTSTHFENIDQNNGEEIMGLHTNEVLNELLIFKRTSLHSYDTYRLRGAGTQGTSAHRSIQTINGITYFFNENGIWAYDGTIPRLISRPIQKYIDGIDQTALTDVFSISSDGKYYKLYVGTIAVDGTTYSNCEIRHSTVDNTFTIYSYDDTFTCYALHETSSVIRVHAGTDDGECMKLAEKDDAVYADDGTAISAEFMFETDMGIPSERKSVDKAIIYAANPQMLKGRVRAKGKDWTSYFTVETDEWQPNISVQDGRILQWNFSESSSVNPFIFEGLTFSPHLQSKKY